MREILNDLLAAYDRGEPCAMATVVRTWRSAPRPDRSMIQRPLSS
jgi:xanthine/CO dehydrogenase XdhC/CoxF family maturation factor